MVNIIDKNMDKIMNEYKHKIMDKNMDKIINKIMDTIRDQILSNIMNRSKDKIMDRNMNMEQDHEEPRQKFGQDVKTVAYYFYNENEMNLD